MQCDRKLDNRRLIERKEKSRQMSRQSDDTPDIIIDELYNKYIRLVAEIAFSVLKDHELAKDATQSAFLSVTQNVWKLKDVPEEKVKNYIIKAARNAAIDIYRNNRYIHKHEVPFPEEGDPEDINNHVRKGKLPNGLYTESFEDEVLRGLDRTVLLKALEKLPPKHMKYIRDRYYENMTMQQVAEKYGITEDAAKKRVYRSLDKLKVLYEKEGSCQNERRN